MRLLAERGAIILRGFPFTRASFTEFSNAACARFSSYVGGGFRFRGLDRQSKDASGTVLSTTGSTQSFPIALHGEMYYQEQRPDVLWFFCEKAPSAPRPDHRRRRRGALRRTLRRVEGSAALAPAPLRPSARRRRLADDVPDRGSGRDEADLCRQRHQRRHGARRLDPHRVPRRGRDGPAAAAARPSSTTRSCSGSSRPASAPGSPSALLGDDVKQLPLVVRLEDGSELPASLVADIERAGEACTVEIVWQEGDIAIVDNRRILHGRRKTGGEAREILVRLGELGAATAA